MLVRLATTPRGARSSHSQRLHEAKIRYLSDSESLRLVNACPPGLRTLVRAALLTGARWGELAALRVADVNASKGHPTMYVAESKSGKPRYIPLNPEGRELFAEAISGKVGDSLVFVRRDGGQWGHNHHVRALNAACSAAKIRPYVAFHELRHTYASHLAQAGVPLPATGEHREPPDAPGKWGHQGPSGPDRLSLFTGNISG